jgi:hypothetical protein
MLPPLPPKETNRFRKTAENSVVNDQPTTAERILSAAERMYYNHLYNVKKYQQRNPQKMKEKSKRYMENLKKDTTKYENYLQKRRTYYKDVLKPKKQELSKEAQEALPKTLVI